MALSTAVVAANGVDLRVPLNPDDPDDAHAMTFPDPSVIVTIVLLKVAWTYTLPALSGRVTFLAVFFDFDLAINLDYLEAAGAVLDTGAADNTSFRTVPTVIRRPLFVRALERVLWPRTGKLLRCRSPRYAPISSSLLIF